MEVRNEGTEQISYFYGTAFFEKAELKQFLKRAETAHQRDHKLIGQEMQLYMPLQATGLWLWKPRGMEFKELLRTVEAKQWKSKTVQHIGLPFIIPANHDDQGNVFIDGRPYSVDFDASEMRQGLLQVCQQSTEQLPLHYVYRRRIYSFLANSQLEGLLESRNGEIDEVYSFCTQDQLIEELTSSLQIIEKAISLFPIEFEWTLYTQCPTGFKNRKAWKEAVELLQGILERQDLKYTLDKEKPSQSGPQLEVSIADAFGRRWVGPYIRIDIPNSPNSKPNLAMFSQSLWGPIERFIALLIESTGGDLPFWLAPEQVRIIPVSKEYFDDALTMSNMIQSAGARSNIDKRQAVLGEKVYAAKCERVPYVIIIGEREKQRDMVSVRSRSTEECKMTVQVFMEQLRKLLKEDEQNKRSFS